MVFFLTYGCLEKLLLVLITPCFMPITIVLCLVANIFCFSLLISEGRRGRPDCGGDERTGHLWRMARMERFVTKPVTPLWRARLLSKGKDWPRMQWV